MTPSKLRWGLLFITVGALLLLNNAGYLDWDYWLELLFWWPVLLIAIGIEKIFQKTKLQFIAYLSPLALIAVMAYIAVDIGPDRWERSFVDRYHWKAESEENIEKIEAVINHGRANLTVNRSSFDLASAKFDRFSRKPDIDFTTRDGVASLMIDRTGGRRSPIIISGRGSYHGWRVSFSDEIPLSLKCNGRSADIDLNLESIPLSDLTVEDDNGDIYLKVGDKMALVSVNVSGEDADLRIKVPEGSGIKFSGDEYAAFLRSLKLIENENFYISEGFNEAETKISFDLDEGLRHLSVTYY
ncbi:MAG: hypothetical protein DRP46_04080 [Candidatus Zixiibacteriota bacterium]|nr:MAG: hypothetical protein DRP46_04080 [candidate division Zixibacteria bacterium]